MHRSSSQTFTCTIKSGNFTSKGTLNEQEELNSHLDKKLQYPFATASSLSNTIHTL